MRVAKKLKVNYEKLLVQKGEEHFYKCAVGSGFMDRLNCKHSEILVLDRAEAFFTLFRQTGNDNYFTIGKILRKAAHRLYRDRFRSSQEPETNSRFLHLVK